MQMPGRLPSGVAIPNGARVATGAAEPPAASCRTTDEGLKEFHQRGLPWTPTAPDIGSIQRPRENLPGGPLSDRKGRSYQQDGLSDVTTSTGRMTS